MNTLLDVIIFAINAHEGQIRKYTKKPYVTHPITVSNIVASVTDDSDMIHAALLHDTIEDTDVTFEEIEEKFGKEIARIVDGLTDVSKPEDGNRAKRKELDKIHLSKGCEKIQTIKLADVISNLSDIERFDSQFANIYFNEKKLLLNVLNKCNKTLYNKAKEIIENYTIKNL